MEIFTEQELEEVYLLECTSEGSCMSECVDD